MVNFFRNVSNFSYSEYRDGSSSFVCFRVYSRAFLDSFLCLGFKASVIPGGDGVLSPYYEVLMEYSEFEKMIRSF